MNKQLLKNIILGIVLIAGALFLYQKYRVPPKIDFVALNTTDLQGQPVDLNDYLGKNIFITMWAPWCIDCIAEMPSIQELSDNLKDEDFVFLAISGYDIQKELNFKNKNTYNFQYLHMDETLKDIGIHSIPTNYILNKKGEVVYEKVGSENWAEAAKIASVKALVKE